MNNREREVASRHVKNPAYTKLPINLRTSSWDRPSKRLAAPNSLNGSEISGNQGSRSNPQLFNKTESQVTRMAGKSFKLSNAYSQAGEDRRSSSVAESDILNKIEKVKTLSQIPTPTKPPLQRARNLSKNEKPEITLTAKEKSNQIAYGLEFPEATVEYDSESSISQRNVSPSPITIAISRKNDGNKRHHSFSTTTFKSTGISRERLEGSKTTRQNDQRRKERILANDQPILPRNKDISKLSKVKVKTVDNKPENTIDLALKHEDHRHNTPFSYSKAHDRTITLGKFLSKDSLQESDDINNAVALINAEYENSFLKNALPSIAKRKLEPLMSILEHTKDTNEENLQETDNPMWEDSVNITTENLTSSPMLKTRHKRINSIKSTAGNLLSISLPVNSRGSKSEEPTIGKTNSTKQASSSINSPSVKNSSSEQEYKLRENSDHQKTINIDVERNKSRNETSNYTSIGDKLPEVTKVSRIIPFISQKYEQLWVPSKSVFEYFAFLRAYDSDKNFHADPKIHFTSHSLSHMISTGSSAKSQTEHKMANKETKVTSPVETLPSESIAQEGYNNLLASSDKQEKYSNRSPSSNSPPKSFEGNNNCQNFNEFVSVPKSDMDPEEQIAGEARLFELQPSDLVSEFNSIRAVSPDQKLPNEEDTSHETPRPKKNPYANQTPKIIGAFIESTAVFSTSNKECYEAAPRLAVSLKDQDLKRETNRNLKLSQLMNGSSSKPVLINTAQRFTASEDIRRIKSEENIEDTDLDLLLEKASDMDESGSIQELSNGKNLELESERSCSYPSQVEMERHIENILIERMKEKLKSASHSIHDTKQGIERLEQQFSISSLHKPTKYGSETDQVVSKISWLYVRTPLSRPKEPAGLFRNRDWNLTWLGLVLFSIFVWFIAELAMCKAFCHPKYSNKNNWQPTDPFFPWAIPTKLDQWSGNIISEAFKALIDWVYPNRHNHQQWPKQPYSGSDWWGGRSGPVPTYMSTSTDEVFWNIDDDELL